MKNNFKFLIVLAILLAGCLCIGSACAADLSVTDINDLSVDDTQNMEIAHDDSSQKDVEITKVSETPGTFKDLNTTINNAIASGNTSIILDKNYKYVVSDDELSEGITISTNNLIIDGNGITIDGSNLARVFTVKASNVVIKNINFINNHATDSDAGAIHGVYGSNNCIIHDCNFTNCSAPSGGAILWNGWNGTFYYCNFVNCSSTDSSWGGGAIFWSRDKGCISGCNFTDCTSNCYGGAVFLDGMAQGTGVTDSIFTNCSAKKGGAIYLIMGNVSLSTFINCYADKGGSIFFSGSEHAIIAYSNFINSSARSGGSIYWDRTTGCIVRESNFTNSIVKYSYMGFNLGGAIYLDNTTSSTLNSSNFINCSAIDEGGAIYDTDSSDTKVISCNFTNDTADSGGAISLSGKKYVYIVNSTFDSCAATSDGGAIFLTDYKKIKCNVSSCNFTNCTADNEGSAIWICSNASLNISNSTCTPAKGDEKAPIYNEGNISSEVIITTLNGNDKLVSYGDIVNVTANVTTSGIPVAGGYVIFDINDLEKKGSSDEKGIYSVEYSINFNGTKPVDATYYNCTGYQTVNAYYLTTVPIVLDINVSASAVYSKNITGSINTTYDGNITLNINGTNYTGKVVNGTFIIPNTDDLNINNYTNVPVSFVSDDGVYIGNTIINFTIDKVDGSFNISVKNISYGKSFTINVTNASDFNGKKLNGTVTVTINGKDYEVNIINGTGSKVVSDILSVGEYLVNATLIIPNYDIMKANTSFAVNKSVPTISVDANNISYGENLTVNLSVTGLGDVPTGNVTILVNGTEVVNVTLTDGKCSYNISDLASGNYNISVIYNGDQNYTAGIENSTNVTVKPTYIRGVEITVKNPDYGADGVVKISLDGVEDKAVPSGNVTISVNGTPYATVNLTNGECSCNISNLGAGLYNISIVYNGDCNYSSERFNANLTVRPVTPQINVSADNITYGEVATVNITVTGVDGKAVPSGNVTIFVNGTEIDNVTLTDGKCNCNISYLGAGNYNITARYNGNQNYTISEGNGNLTVNKANPKFIILNVSDYIYGANITIGANVSGSGWVAPNGYVYFRTWNITVPLNDEGIASANIGVLPSGSYNCFIGYYGDKNYNQFIHISRFNVYKAVPEVIISVDNITYGENAVVNVSVSGAGDTPSGNVTFYLGTDEITVSLENGTASYTFSGLSVGNYSGSVKYNGNNNYNSTLDSFEFNVAKADPDVGVEIFSERAFEIKFGDTVVGIANLPDDATGNVSFSIDNETWETVPITDDKNYVEYHIPGLDAGNYILFVKYNGDDNYNPNYSENPFNIRQLETVVTVDPVKGKAGEKVTIIARVTDEDGNPVEDGYVIIGFNGKEYKAYVENGIATVEVVLPKAGTYSATAYYEGFNYNSSYTTFTVEVSAIPGPNPTPINNGGGNMENTGNPLLVLLIALSAIGLESFRRKF